MYSKYDNANLRNVSIVLGRIGTWTGKSQPVIAYATQRFVCFKIIQGDLCELLSF